MEERTLYQLFNSQGIMVLSIGSWQYTLSIRSVLSKMLSSLTHGGLVTPYDVINLSELISDNGSFVCCRVITWTKKCPIANREQQLLWNSERNQNFFIKENTVEYVFRKLAAILFRSQWYN